MDAERKRITQAAYQKTPRGREVARRARLKLRYRITPEWYDAQLEAQGGRCAICRSDDPRGRWGTFCVDHDHATGAARALLCLRCNSNLGWYERHRDAVRGYVDD